MNAEQEDMDITLPMLETIGRQSDITQRSLAKQLNLALGLTNSYLKNSVRKGLIKIEQVPANRYLYYLTPKGLAEKGRLAAKYLKRSFDFYRQASDDCFQLFQQCREQGWDNVVICGVSDLAEIAILQAAKAEVEIVGVFDKRHKLEHFFGKASWQDLACLPQDPVCLITALERPLRMRQALLKVTAEERVLVPAILKI
jgi:DNA-binding MarR family transcriptional regulator